MCKTFFKSILLNSGFTLIELLVVVGIIILVLTISVPSFRTFSRKQTLKSEAEKMVARLELAQSKAKSGDQGENETDEVQGFMVDFSSVIADGKYYLKKHKNDVSVPLIYVTTEDEYSLNSDITTVVFEANGVGTAIRIFYYQSPRAYLSCLTAVPVNGNEQSECLSSQFPFKITLQNAKGEAHYVYIEKGGVVYDSES